MELKEDEKNYISDIYRHGLNNLEDSIPAKVICVHTVHWCLEYLLRKATYDIGSLNYRDGFGKIFDKFKAKNEGELSPKLQKSVEKFNALRNGLVHQGFYPDFSVLRKLLEDVNDFIEWLLQTKFNNAQLDLQRLSNYEIEQYFKRFYDWKEKILPRSEYRAFKENETQDSVFICIIPSSICENLVDFDADQINDSITSSITGNSFISISNPAHHPEIEKFFREYRILGSTQVYSTPQFLREYDEVLGSEILVHPSGLVFIQLQYGNLHRKQIIGLEEKQFVFDLDHFFTRNSTEYIHENACRKYGTPFDRIQKDNLEDLFKTVCFPFNPKCKIKMIRNPTEKFQVVFIFPGMIVGDSREHRYLDTRDKSIALRSRKFLGKESDIIYKGSFVYYEIPQMLQRMMDYCYGFFKNESDTHFA